MKQTRKRTRIPIGNIFIGAVGSTEFTAELYYAALYYYGDFAFTLITNGIPHTRDETRNLYPTLLFDKIYLMALNFDFTYYPIVYEAE